MKTAEPKIIYLQIGEDADITEFEESDFQTNAITWCWERIFDNDIEYLSKQSIISLVDNEILQNAIKHDNAMANVKPEAFEFFEELYKLRLVFLTELKQKIEQLDKESE